MRQTFVACSFSTGLDELPRKVQKDKVSVLAFLAKHPRVSTFEVCANQGIAGTMTYLLKQGLIDEPVKQGYPWHKFRVTKAGKAFLENNYPALVTKKRSIK